MNYHNLFFAFLPLFLFSCGGSDTSETTESVDDSLSQFEQNVLIAKELKTKLGEINTNFTEIANKELEESVCPSDFTIDFVKESDEIDVLLISNYLLANFDTNNSGAYDFMMPDINLPNGTPLREFDWLNFSSNVPSGFGFYSKYPDLNKVNEATKSTDPEIDQQLNDVVTISNLLENGLMGIVAIVDYMPPSFKSISEFEAGYLMGYILFVDGQTNSVSCMTPFLAENSATLSFSAQSTQPADGGKLNGTLELEADLRNQTVEQFKIIVSQITGHKGVIRINP